MSHLNGICVLFILLMVYHKHPLKTMSTLTLGQCLEHYLVELCEFFMYSGHWFLITCEFVNIHSDSASCLFKIILGIKVNFDEIQIIIESFDSYLMGDIFKMSSFIQNYKNFYGVSSEFQSFCLLAYAMTSFRENSKYDVGERSQLVICSCIEQIQDNILKWHIPQKIAMCSFKT